MKILLFGITDFCANILDKLIRDKYEICGIICNQSNNIDIQEMKQIAALAKIPVFECDKVKDPAFITKVKNTCTPDIICVFTFDQLIPKELYSIAKIAAINLHPSLLPLYRGCHPYFWPIANGEKETGLTFHYLAEEFDTGDIVAQEKMKIDPLETSGMLIERQKILSWQMLKPILDEIRKSGQAPKAIAQATGDFIKAPKVQLKDYFIDWNWPNQKILDRIRALNPFSAAFTIYKGLHIGIYQAETAALASLARPGTIIDLVPPGPIVKTNDGALLLKVMLAGRKYLLSGADFVKYEKVSLNERLGN